MPYRIYFGWSIATSNLVTTIVVVLQLWTFPLKMSLNSTLIASSLLTQPSAPLIASIVGGWSAPAVTGQMADFIALVASGSTWTVMYKPCQCSASCSVVVVVGSECSLRCPQTSFNSLSNIQQKCRFSYPLARLRFQLHLALSLL
ncbi:hypothetical protein Tco_0151954 [Tanacetum coccineum]